MSFLLPLGLLALLALPIIAALHLIRQRRRRERVPTTVLWQALRTPPERRQRRLPLTLLLLLHLLVGLCLALALSQPALRPFGKHVPTHTVIVLDTTTSMAATDAAPSRFDQARSAALDLIDELSDNDTAAIIELDGTPRLLANGGPADAERLADAVRALAPAGNGADLPGALHLANGSLSSSQSNRVVVLTDDALQATGPLSVAADLDWRTWGGSSPNMAIVAFAARRFGGASGSGETALYARVANFSPNAAARTLRLLVDGEERDRQNLQIPGGGSEERTWRLSDGSRAQLRLDGADALLLDDQADLPLEQARSVRVRLISAEASALERVLAALPGLQVTVAPRVDPDAPPVDVTVLNGLLPDPLPPGALLIVNPPADSQLPGLPTVFGERASSATLDQAFGGIDLSSVQWGGRHPLAAWPATLQPAIATGKSVPLVLRGTVEGQPAVVWAFDVDASNLPVKLAFPLLADASLAVLTTGALPPTLPPGAPAPPVALLQPDGRPLPADGRLLLPGLYALRDPAGELAGGVAINFGDNLESNLQILPSPQVAAVPDELAIEPAPGNGWRLWPLLVGLALAALAFEWWYVYGR